MDAEDVVAFTLTVVRRHPRATVLQITLLMADAKMYARFERVIPLSPPQRKARLQWIAAAHRHARAVGARLWLDGGLWLVFATGPTKEERVKIPF